MPSVNQRPYDDDRLAEYSKQEVIELAENARQLREDNRPIPENSPHSFALARVLRLSGAFGGAAAKKAVEIFGYEEFAKEVSYKPKAPNAPYTGTIGGRKPE